MFAAKWELAVFRNRLRLTDLKSGETGERAAIYPFSTSRMLIANQECLEQEFKELAIELSSKRRFFIYPEVRIVSTESPLEPVERDALRRAIADAGASKVFFMDERA